MPSPKTMFDELPWFLFNIGARLNELKVFYSVGGIIPPLYDALVLVRDSGCQTPEWVIDGAIRIVGDRLKQGYTIGYGPTGNELPNTEKIWSISGDGKSWKFFASKVSSRAVFTKRLLFVSKVNLAKEVKKRSKNPFLESERI